jgi:hypothetical protein
MEENPNFPRDISDKFLTQIWEGHRKSDAVTFFVWIQDHRGMDPAVRVSCRKLGSSTWTKVPSETLRYRNIPSFKMKKEAIGN